MAPIADKAVLFGSHLQSLDNFNNVLEDTLNIPKFLCQYWESDAFSKDISKEDFGDTAIQLLEYFIQTNYTGPFLPIDPVHWLPPSLRNHEKLHASILEALTEEGERPYHLTPKLLFILLAQTLFEYAQSSKPAHIWHRIRLDFLHQQLLRSHVSVLFNRITENAQLLNGYIQTQDQDTQGRFAMELGLIQSYYDRDAAALQLLKDSGSIMGFNFELTGAAGRRTKFQTFDTSQLVVLAKSRDRNSGTPLSEQSKTQPKTFNLNDDTLLERVSFKEDSMSLGVKENVNPLLATEDPNHPSELHPLDASLLLAFCHIIKNNNPDDGLTREEMSPYAERVLVHPINWSVYTMGLLVRARLEGFKSRTVERSVLQMQALFDQLNDELSSGASTDDVDQQTNTGSFLPKPKEEGETASLQERLAYFYSLRLPSRWQLEAELAERFVSVGATKSALEIYERLQMWDRVVVCQCSLDRSDLAVQVIERQLSIDPKEHLLRTMLGDIQNEPKHYMDAWELSGERYAPAQRSLGRYYFKQGEMMKAMDAFYKSLRINPLSHPTWFTYGCAALGVKNYDAAMEAFTRCLSISPEDGESWNNLASAMLKADTHSKKEAWHTIQQGLKYMYDSWRVWENYMLISVDVNQWTEVIRALRRIIEIKSKAAGEKAVDVQCLDLVVSHVMQTCDDDSAGIAKMLNELVRIIIPLITNDTRLWKIIARYNLWKRKYAESLDATIKSYRILISSPNITTDEATWNRTVADALELVEAYENLGEKPGRMGGVVAKDWKFKSRSILRSLLGTGKDSWSETESYQKILETLKELR
ncbi:TTC27 family TPR repeat protein [Schizosaccharomyces octosporus yFS286]|uniref:TTC27 family TPR repeat protein n=1 Tax=Schizosaccharomyces octosporus (strain yFS286) TaxID=483514 RepID=S9PZR1_SCHOY|nr:TTC27 family TPR repeat protein [Schizosaccharomyces octosporus yFS286]EPX72948.1 TTC27 family TPR repeat protein [Schizosaccharomyces octosporus yFS286]